MFERVTIGVADLFTSRRFYAATLGPLGIGVSAESATGVVFGDFAITLSQPVTTGLHVGFAAARREHARRFHRAGLEAGGGNAGEAGPRPAYGDDYFGAFLEDPDGNRIEAALHENQVTTPAIDHLWIRVADLEEARARYEPLGWPLVAEQASSARFRRAPKQGSFTLIEGAPLTTPFELVLDRA